MVSFVVAMNRVDVVDLVVDLVDVGLVDVVLAVFSVFGLQLYLCFLPPRKKYKRSEGYPWDPWVNLSLRRRRRVRLRLDTFPIRWRLRCFS